MKAFRVVVSFEIDAENDHDAIRVAAAESPNNAVLESIAELPEPDLTDIPETDEAWFARAKLVKPGHHQWRTHDAIHC